MGFFPGVEAGRGEGICYLSRIKLASLHINNVSTEHLVSTREELLFLIDMQLFIILNYFLVHCDCLRNEVSQPQYPCAETI